MRGVFFALVFLVALALGAYTLLAKQGSRDQRPDFDRTAGQDTRGWW
jgi:hypothetical protein